MVLQLIAEHGHVFGARRLCRIVSATDMRKYDDPPGLQDNGELLFNWLAGQHSVCAVTRQCHSAMGYHRTGVVKCSPLMVQSNPDCAAQAVPHSDVLMMLQAEARC